MADSSYVTVTCPGWAAPVIQLSIENFPRGEYSAPTSTDPDHGCQVTFEEASWGLNNDDVVELLEFLTAHRVPWHGHDAGHYTWDPFVSWWNGDDDQGDCVPATQDGTVMVTAAAMELILAADEPTAASKRYFGAQDRVVHSPRPELDPLASVAAALDE